MAAVKKLLKNLTRKFKVHTGMRSKPKGRAGRLQPRIRLADGRVNFLRQGGQEIKVLNISCTGVAFDIKGFSSPPKVGEIFQGTLRVGKTSFEMECFVIHVSSSLVGCEFTDDTSALESVLKAAFELELRAHNLIKIRRDILSPREKGLPYYFHGGARDELYYVTDKESVLHFILIFDGEFIEGGTEHPLKMGKLKLELKSHSNDPGAMYPVELYQNSDPQLLNLAKIFLDNIDDLDESHREAIKRLLR